MQPQIGGTEGVSMQIQCFLVSTDSRVYSHRELSESKKTGVYTDAGGLASNPRSIRNA